MLQSFSNYFHAIIHLKPEQVIYRLYYLLLNKENKSDYIHFIPRQSYQLVMKDSIASYMSYSEKNNFSFLNQIYQFNDKISWNYTENGMLWAYNLNYFEFLHQPTMDVKIGLRLIYDYIEEYRNIRVGYDSYPISLRNIFWIRFLTKHEIHDEKIDSFLYETYTILLRHLEYHLLGNHLLENAFSLLFGAYYFRDIALYHKSYVLLKKELKEQILNDGGHFELSPMYHQILFYRLLDCINLVATNKWKEDDLFDFLSSKAAYMLSWLKNMTLPSGVAPFFNDASGGIAPSSRELFRYAKLLDIPDKNITLSDSNYRIFRSENYICICDIGSISPPYQCGHAHADTFNFVLEIHNQPIFVDTGCSTYEKNQIRYFERGTSAHNTVTVNGSNSNQVWASHRVGKRAKVTVLIDTPDKISVCHDGFKNLGKIHTRTYNKTNNSVEIIDEINGNSSGDNSTAFFHLDYSVDDISIVNNQVIIQNRCFVYFEGAKNIYINKYEQALGFNERVDAKCICVDFTRWLKSIIIPDEVAT